MAVLMGISIITQTDLIRYMMTTQTAYHVALLEVNRPRQRRENEMSSSDEGATYALIQLERV